jgi:long-chain acyl-CoA synthetase
MNLAHYLEASAENFPQKDAVRHEGDVITYQELNGQCNRFAAGLQKLGLAAQDRCVLMMPNSIQVIIAYFALAKLGAVTVPVNFLYRRHELMHIIADSKPKGFIGAAPYLDEVCPVLAKTDTTSISIRVAAGNPDQADFIDFESVYMSEAAFSTYPAASACRFPNSRQKSFRRKGRRSPGTNLVNYSSRDPVS